MFCKYFAIRALGHPSNVLPLIFMQVFIFIESLAEAKEKAAKGNSNEQNTEVGRGFRTSKPTDYFSPAEEEERFQEKIRRKGLPKKG